MSRFDTCSVVGDDAVPVEPSVPVAPSVPVVKALSECPLRVFDGNGNFNSAAFAARVRELAALPRLSGDDMLMGM